MAQTALVLQGGGALGAYECGALMRLYEDRGFQPTHIAGVSIGAITAAAIVGARENDPCKALESMWDSFTVPSPPFLPDFLQQFLALFGNMNFFTMRDDYFNCSEWTSFYETHPLRKTLEKFISFEAINQSKIRLILTATNITTGGIEIFDNDKRGPITADHVIASGALPPGFPMIEINHRSYWDGGIFDNSPLSPIIDAMDPDPFVPKQIIVMNLFPGHGSVPRNMMQVLDRVFEITFSNKFRSAFEDTEKVNQYVEVIKAIDDSLPEDHPVRNMEGYKTLKKYTLVHDIIYIENTNPELVFGPFDFSKKSIRSRISAGYRDADAVLKQQPKRSLPAGMIRT